ncbi:MAG: rRNA maturation RNase YbeY [Acholeplasmataceae bacterium]|jgi:probable rRNA maturation factor|nr:rRNA maturation RNase YbeY [Acholeplasmataceae bacterium]
MKQVKINIFNELDIDLSNYEKTLKKVFKPIKDKKNINLILTSDERIHTLNKTFRNVDRPTDVLSFINDEDKDSNGDIFISIPKMKRQAVEYGHSEDREISFLAVHGYLHLIGFDHENEEDEKIMNYETERILSLAKLERKKE